MKKIFLLLAFVFSLGLNAQITLDNTYPGAYSINLVKLSISGYKYVKIDPANMNVSLYNPNHSLFKSMTVPPVYGNFQNALYISETLFNTDNLVEYAVQSYSPAANKRYFYIFNENGVLLMSRDSAVVSGSSGADIFTNQDAVFFDGSNTKLKLTIYNAGVGPTFAVKNEIYTLPGTMPCAECSTGTITGFASPSGSGGSSGNPVFYPNPVTDQLKLRYELPAGYKKAEINIYDLQGKLMESLKVTSTFDFIYLPSDYNNGLYLYALIVDGKTIKTEKILLNK